MIGLYEIEKLSNQTLGVRNPEGRSKAIIETCRKLSTIHKLYPPDVEAITQNKLVEQYILFGDWILAAVDIKSAYWFGYFSRSRRYVGDNWISSQSDLQEYRDGFNVKSLEEALNMRIDQIIIYQPVMVDSPEFTSFFVRWRRHNHIFYGDSLEEIKHRIFSDEFNEFEVALKTGNGKKISNMIKYHTVAIIDEDKIKTLDDLMIIIKSLTKMEVIQARSKLVHAAVYGGEAMILYLSKHLPLGKTISLDVSQVKMLELLHKASALSERSYSIVWKWIKPNAEYHEQIIDISQSLRFAIFASKQNDIPLTFVQVVSFGDVNYVREHYPNYVKIILSLSESDRLRLLGNVGRSNGTGKHNLYHTIGKSFVSLPKIARTGNVTQRENYVAWMSLIAPTSPRNLLEFAMYVLESSNANMRFVDCITVINKTTNVDGKLRVINRWFFDTMIDHYSLHPTPGVPTLSLQNDMKPYMRLVDYAINSENTTYYLKKVNSIVTLETETVSRLRTQAEKVYNFNVTAWLST